MYLSASNDERTPVNINNIKAELERIMPGVELTYEFDPMYDELVVRTNLLSHEYMPDDTPRLATADDSLEFDAVDLGNKVMALFPAGEFVDDDFCQVYIATGLARTSDPDVLELAGS